MTAWLILLLAGIAEIIWAVSMKLSEGFSKPTETAISFVSAAVSISLLSYSMKTLSVSIAYPLWVAIGVLGVSIIGVVCLKEPISTAKVVCILLILSGSIGLKVVKP